jgi:uncharacterized protein (TIGR02145 family)
MKFLFFLLCFVVFPTSVFSQVGINTAVPDPSSILEVSATDKGMLIPRLTTTQRTSIASPANGLLVYDINTNSFWFYKASFWIELGAISNIYTQDGTLQSDRVVTLDGKKLSFSGSSGVKVGDNSASISASSAFEIESVTKGFLPPRMTTAQRNAIVNQSIGLVIYNTDVSCLQFRYSSGWYNLCDGSTETGGPNGGDPPPGSSYTNFFNGWTSGSVYTGTTTTVTHTQGEAFSSNTNCASSLISTSTSCPTTVSTTSNTYNTVFINGQCWMSENLREKPTLYSFYSPVSWLNVTPPGDMGYWGYYNTTTTNGSAGWGLTPPATGEGYLYQWSAAMNGSTTERARGACPLGWHVPSDCEWMYLEHGIGMRVVEQTDNNVYRGITSDGTGVPGYKLKSQGAGQNNASGFTALLNGIRNTNGVFNQRSSTVYYWTSTLNAGVPIERRISDTTPNGRGVFRGDTTAIRGASLRCLKDN